MSQKAFKFKQFSIEQDRCAMKIGSDAVLLGSIISGDYQNALEIGSGTGVISLMMAQRFPNLKIQALELDEQAVQQSQENVQNSIFSDQISIIQADFMQFSSNIQYDLIFSNPPYFHQSLKSGTPSRDLARHMDQDQLLAWIDKAYSLMHEESSLWMVLPSTNFQAIEKHLLNLHVHTKMNIQSFPESEVIRLVFELKKNESKNGPKEHFMWIYEKEKRYSKEYTSLLKDFLIIF